MAIQFTIKGLSLNKLFFIILFCAVQVTITHAQKKYDKNLSVHSNMTSEDTVPVIIDAAYTFEQVLEGSTIPYSVKKNLELISVTYFGFDSRLHQGQLLVNKKVSKDLKDIFTFIKEIKFPVEKVIPIVRYNWSDEQSMEDNNTSSFNYRFISGSKILSMHANGMAIDINPKQNPYVKNGDSSPPGSDYNPSVKGTITPGSELVNAFKKKGWTWGGEWDSLKDYQHFQKKLR